jgi:hypothetical protein
MVELCFYDLEMPDIQVSCGRVPHRGDAQMQTEGFGPMPIALIFLTNLHTSEARPSQAGLITRAMATRYVFGRALVVLTLAAAT